MIHARHTRLLLASALLFAACSSGLPDDPGPGAPLITTGTPSDAVQGLPYTFRIEASGGAGARAWSLGSVPADLQWLAIDPATGDLSGTPGKALMPGLNFSANVVDAQGRSDSRALKLTVLECAPNGSRTECFVADAGQCTSNSVLCTDGKIPACAKGSASLAMDHCGPSCAPCATESADNCQGTCRCGGGPACTGGQATCCSAACTDLQTDVANCGACGAACAATPPAHAHLTCVAKKCDFGCDPGFTRCGDQCVNQQADGANCGACANACAAGTVCLGGTCQLACTAGLTNCSGACVNLQTDTSNCSSCGRVCPAGPAGSSISCTGGNCSTPCTPGLTPCASGTVCANLASDPANCGACGTTCPAGPANSSPTCSGGCGWNCNAGFTNCSGACVNLSSNAANCGACGTVCSDPFLPGGAVDVCSGGLCNWKCPGTQKYCALLDVCVTSLAQCKDPTCFVAGTPVALADGAEVAIEEVREGDRVLSYDLEAGAFVEGLVTGRLVHTDTPALLRINGTLTTTPEHRFFAGGRWVRADALRLGDQLLKSGVGPGGFSGFEPVVQLELLPGGVTTYNLEVEGFHDYFAGGVLVHNIKVIP